MKLSRALILLSIGLPPSIAFSQAEPTAKLSPFDKEDPEIQKLRALNWKDIDFDAQDLKTKCQALLAMQDVLSTAGGKASARVELLVDYIDQEKLGEAFVASKEALALPPLISYDDAKKICMAFIRSDVGKNKFAQELDEVDEPSLRAYFTMYTNSSRRAFEECVEARIRVRDMALYLESTAKLDQFKLWARDQVKAKQAAKDQETAKLREAKVAAEKARQEVVLAKRREAEQRAATQMEAYLNSQQQTADATAGTTVVVDDGWDGDTWWPGTGAYYASDAYRGYVRDKFQDRWQNWNGGGGGAQPKARGGGGRARGRR